MTERLDRDPLIAKLRHMKAAKLELQLADGTQRKVAIPKSGNRWVKLAEVLDSVDWHYLEAQDADGAMLGRIENDDDAPDDDAPGFGENGDGCCPACGRRSESRTLLEVMRTTQRETRLAFAVQMDALPKLVEQFASATSHLTESYGQSMKLRDAATVAEAQGSPEFANMLQMAMMLMAQNKLPPQSPGGGK